MTSDRAAKKAARARTGATGQSYLSARRAVAPAPGRPAEVAPPAGVDPQEHAIGSHHWGVQAGHLVRYEGRYYAWFTSASADASPQVYQLPGEQEARDFIDDWQVANVLHTPWDETLAHIFLLDAAAQNGICYHAAVVDVADSGIWLACSDHTGADEATRVLARFAGLGEALQEFAALAEQAADQAGANPALTLPDVVAGVLRYRAATTRAQAAKAALGDVIRRNEAQVRDARFWPTLHEAGVNRDSFGAVLAGRDYAWPQGPVVRPPGGPGSK